MHSQIIDLGVKLGYFKDNLGACRGVTMAWISAFLTDEKQQKKYLYYVQKITEEGTELFHSIQKMKQKISNGEALSKEDIDLYDYLAFYEQMTLYLHPSFYREWFGNQVRRQHDIDDISYLANPAPLDAKGGLGVVHTSGEIYNKASLLEYLKGVATLVDIHSGSIGIIFGNHSHAIGLTYDPKNQAWQLMDINQGAPAELALEVIVEELLEGFNSPRHIPRKEYVALVAQVISADSPADRQLLKDKLQLFKDQYRKDHPLTPMTSAQRDANLLYISAEIGDMEVVETLIAAGVDINQTGHGTTPLYIASQHGYVDVVTRLLAEENININKTTLKDATPLHIASQLGHVDIVRALLAKEQIKINEATKDGVTPLLIAAYNGHLEVVQALLRRDDVQVNVKNNKGYTPLHLAVAKGYIHLVHALLANTQVNIQEPNNIGFTPFETVVVLGNIDIVNAFLDTGRIEINKVGLTPLHLAAEFGRLNVFNRLVEYGFDINQKLYNEGSSPLHLAAKKGHVDVVKALLSQDNIELNIEDSAGLTPLHLAAQQGQTDVVIALLEQSNIDIYGGARETPLILAAQNGHFDIVKRLLEMPSRSNDTTHSTEAIKILFNKVINAFVLKATETYQHNPEKLKQMSDFFEDVTYYIGQLNSSPNDRITTEEETYTAILSLADDHFKHDNKIIRILLDVMVGFFTAGLGFLVNKVVTGSFFFSKQDTHRTKNLKKELHSIETVKSKDDTDGESSDAMHIDNP